MNNVVWMVVKDEEFYISMAIESVINHVQDEGGLFILDTGSMDNTVELILSYQFLNPGKIVLEQQDFGSNDFKPGDFRFASGFREMDARNYALKRAVEMSDPDGWVICLDGDEVYNDRFWDVLDTIEEDALIYIGTLPINPYLASNHPLDVQEINGVKLFDPHLKVWRAGIPVK
jgi:glycosyltransferase involved in cell wall biosynthesis